MKPERKRGSASLRKDNYTTVLLLTMACTLVFRIPLSRIMGDKGVAYFGTANELYMVLGGLFGYGLSEAVAVLIRYRMKRQQFKNAQKVMSGALLLGAGTGLVLSPLIGISAHGLADKVLKMPLSGMAIRIMAPAIFFYILTGVLRGYFQGNGSKVPAMHSCILHTIFLFVGGLIGATAFHSYGEKVSALLQNEDYACAYGALGASVGLLTASAFCFLHMAVLYFMLKGRMKKQEGREAQRGQDTTPRILQLLLGTGGLYGAYYLILNSHTLIHQYLLYHFGDITEGLDTLWGVYYGKYLVVIGIVTGIVLLFCLMPVRRIVLLLEHEEYRGAKERLGALIHQCAVITIPAAVFLAVLSENVLNLLFKGNQKQVVPWLQLGSVAMVFAVFGIVFMEILIKIRQLKMVVLSGTAALVIHIVAVIILLSGPKLDINGIIIGSILFWAVMTVAGFFLIGRKTQYTQEWIRSFAIPIVAAAVSGLIAMLLNKALSSFAGSLISLIISLLVGVALYLVLLIVSKSLREEELELMTGGYLIVRLAKSLRLM